jgi:hypothetical protein
MEMSLPDTRPFARFEKYDLNAEVSSGATKSDALDLTELSAGVKETKESVTADAVATSFSELSAVADAFTLAPPSLLSSSPSLPKSASSQSLDTHDAEPSSSGKKSRTLRRSGCGSTT